MFSLELRARGERRDLLIADLWEAGSVGITELDDERLRAFFDDAADAGALAARFAEYEPRARREEERDWVEHAREGWRPILAGARFFLVPEWRNDPTPPGRFRIEVNPGMAFGTGLHETTQLAIEALERHVRAPLAVIDVGTGSGILARAAELLGAGRVIACDNDPVAVEIARGNIPSALLFAGSADAVAARAADVVVANISPEAIAALAGEIRRVLRPGGLAVLSGFEAHETDKVRSALPGGAVLHTAAKGAWGLIDWRP